MKVEDFWQNGELSHLTNGQKRNKIEEEAWIDQKLFLAIFIYYLHLRVFKLLPC
jgi:hypothetical protein